MEIAIGGDERRRAARLRRSGLALNGGGSRAFFDLLRGWPERTRLWLVGSVELTVDGGRWRVFNGDGDSAARLGKLRSASLASDLGGEEGAALQLLRLRQGHGEDR